MFVADERYCLVSKALNHRNGGFCFVRIEREIENVLENVVVHIVEALVSIELFVFCIAILYPVFVPKFGYCHTEIGCPSYGDGRVFRDLRYCICHIVGFYAVPIVGDILAFKEFSVKSRIISAKLQERFACLFFKPVKLIQ